MYVCEQCGKEIEDGGKFCPACGKPVNGTQVTAAAAEDNTKTMSILAYILFFVPLLTGAHKQSEAVKFHTNQGTVLFIAAAIYGVAYSILSMILIFIPYVGWALIAILGLCSLGIAALCILGIVHAMQGQCKPLPLIGKIAIVK
jgi:uncharacterized membrane protein